MSRITQGKWYRGTGNDCHKILDEGGRIICDNVGYADGNLISEAPTLLELCKAFLAINDDTSEFDKAAIRENAFSVVRRAEYL